MVGLIYSRTARMWTVIAVIGVALAVLYAAQRSFIYFPEGQVASPAAAGLPSAETVQFATEDGLDLDAWFVPARRAGRQPHHPRVQRERRQQESPGVAGGHNSPSMAGRPCSSTTAGTAGTRDCLRKPDSNAIHALRSVICCRDRTSTRRESCISANRWEPRSRFASPPITRRPPWSCAHRFRR